MYSIFYTLQLVKQYPVASLLVLMSAVGYLLNHALNQNVELVYNTMDIFVMALVSCAGRSVVARDVVVNIFFFLLL